MKKFNQDAKNSAIVIGSSEETQKSGPIKRSSDNFAWSALIFSVIWELPKIKKIEESIES